MSWLFIFLLAVASGPIPSFARYEKTPDEYREGNASLSQKDYFSAIYWFSESVQKYPDFMEGRVKLAKCYKFMFDTTGLYYTEALASYEEILFLRLNDPEIMDEFVTEAIIGKSEILMRGGEYEKAIEALTPLTVTSKGEILAHVWDCIGVAHYYLNNYQEASAAFVNALRVDPTLKSALFNQRSIFTRLGLFDQAMANIRMGNERHALADLDQLLVLAPRYGPAIIQKSLILLRMQRTAEAVQLMEKSLGLRLKDLDAFELMNILGDTLAQNGNPQAAFDWYRKSLRILPGFIQTVSKMIALEEKLGIVQSSDVPSAAAETQAKSLAEGVSDSDAAPDAHETMSAPTITNAGEFPM